MDTVITVRAIWADTAIEGIELGFIVEKHVAASVSTANLFS
jgi:hypothetical protein